MTARAEGTTRRVRGRARAKALTGMVAAARREYRLVSALVLLAAGVTLVLLGWYGAAHTNILSEQIPYLISGGILGLGLIIVAGVFAASATNERSNDALRREIASSMARMTSGGAAPRSSSGAGTIDTDATVYVVPGGRSYHSAGCPIVEGKDGVTEMTVAQARETGSTACKLCGAE